MGVPSDGLGSLGQDGDLEIQIELVEVVDRGLGLRDGHSSHLSSVSCPVGRDGVQRKACGAGSAALRTSPAALRGD